MLSLFEYNKNFKYFKFPRSCNRAIPLEIAPMSQLYRVVFHTLFAAVLYLTYIGYRTHIMRNAYKLCPTCKGENKRASHMAHVADKLGTHVSSGESESGHLLLSGSPIHVKFYSRQKYNFPVEYGICLRFWRNFANKSFHPFPRFDTKRLGTISVLQSVFLNCR